MCDFRHMRGSVDTGNVSAGACCTCECQISLRSTSGASAREERGGADWYLAITRDSAGPKYHVVTAVSGQYASDALLMKPSRYGGNSATEDLTERVWRNTPCLNQTLRSRSVLHLGVVAHHSPTHPHAHYYASHALLPLHVIWGPSYLVRAHEDRTSTSLCLVVLFWASARC